jgi:GNAT superfamily N-acetyltransferase
MNSTWEVERTTQGARRQAAWVLGRAFQDEQVSIAVYRHLSPEKRLKNLVVDFSAELEVCARRGAPLHICQAGQVVAAAVIYPPGTYPLPKREELWLLLRTTLGHAFYDVRFCLGGARLWLRWLAAAGAHHPREPHYFLEYLGVEPGFQGRGLGSAILRRLAVDADTAGVGCYLETATPRNLPLYQRFGFRVFAQQEIIGVPAWFLWRPASPAPAGHASKD